MAWICWLEVWAGSRRGNLDTAYDGEFERKVAVQIRWERLHVSLIGDCVLLRAKVAFRPCRLRCASIKKNELGERVRGKRSVDMFICPDVGMDV